MTLSLIPAGQPHGDRIKNEEAADAAGLAKKAPQTAPQPDFSLSPPVQQATPREQGEFDALASRSPQSFGQLRQDQDSRVVETLSTSPSPVLRDIANRLRGF